MNNEYDEAWLARTKVYRYIECLKDKATCIVWDCDKRNCVESGTAATFFLCDPCYDKVSGIRGAFYVNLLDVIWGYKSGTLGHLYGKQ